MSVYLNSYTIGGCVMYHARAYARPTHTRTHIVIVGTHAPLSLLLTNVRSRLRRRGGQARADSASPTAQFSPCPIDEVCATIARERPAVVFAPHVETSAGLILPDDYIRAVADVSRSSFSTFPALPSSRCMSPPPRVYSSP